ncbi:MAG: stage V sporulation protein AD [Hungatella sp.]|nr:stage V sporulation protein AD [Hungatella sp.]
MQKGKSSIEFEAPPVISSSACVAGKKEGEGPLGPLIDVVEQDEMFGTETWEQAESAMQKQAADLALEKGDIRRQEIRYLFAGDLLGQLIATSFGTVDMEIPLFGLYGACSTIGEALTLSAMTVHGGYGDRVLAVSSSHFATAEKQFRFPLAYGNQRPFSSTWTVTGAGAFVVSDSRKDAGGGSAKITGVTPGKIVDFGSRDSMNMGAAMAPAAYGTIRQNFQDFGVDETHYDRIITGDLGEVGSKILLDMMRQSGSDLTGIHMDCGMEIFEKETQDTHAGGSGCGCAAVTLCAMVLPRIRSGEWKRVLFLPTGALLSTVSFNEGQSIPGICHGVVLEQI